MESELVSGFMTEHAAVIFVFFFLAEYASIVLICILTSILFLGGYLITIMPIYYIMYTYEVLSTIVLNVSINISQIINDILNFNFNVLNTNIKDAFQEYCCLDHYISKNEINLKPILNGLFPSIVLGLKSCIMIFVFIWVRASFPRIRFDQLMSLCWTILLPLVISFIIIVPCILYTIEILPSNEILL